MAWICTRVADSLVHCPKGDICDIFGVGCTKVLFRVECLLNDGIAIATNCGESPKTRSHRLFCVFYD
jgi:hypothetical protein